MYQIAPFTASNNLLTQHNIRRCNGHNLMLHFSTKKCYNSYKIFDYHIVKYKKYNYAHLYIYIS